MAEKGWLMTRVGWALVAGIVLVGATAGCSSTPKVPDEAALPLVARAVLKGEITPDATEGVDPDTLPLSPNGQECVEINRPAGPWSLCWAAHRDPQDSDPAQDYYRFKVYGTFGGEAATGVRWASVLVRLVGEPSNNVFINWPRDVFDGPCDQVDVTLMIGPPEKETLCGRTSASDGREAWSYLVTWTCECLVPDHADRSLPLHQEIAVPQGTVPTWEIFADLGS
jgi:hypothetical protein